MREARTTIEMRRKSPVSVGEIEARSEDGIGKGRGSGLLGCWIDDAVLVEERRFHLPVEVDIVTVSQSTFEGGS